MYWLTRAERRASEQHTACANKTGIGLREPGHQEGKALKTRGYVIECAIFVDEIKSHPTRIVEDLKRESTSLSGGTELFVLALTLFTGRLKIKDR